MERGFYAVNAHPVDSEALEKAFGPVEGLAIKVFKKIDSGTWPLSVDDRIALGAFVILQALRGPNLRQLAESLQAGIVERENQRVAEHGAAKWFAERGLQLTEQRAREGWDAAVGTGEPLVTIDAAYHARQIATHAETVLPYLLGRYWTLVRFDAPTLITSDAPVSLHDVEDGPRRWGLLNAPSISLPLSRTTALVFGATYSLESEDDAEALLGGAFDQVVQGDNVWKKRLNARTVHNATRTLFHHPDDATLIPSELPRWG
ncbi:uncharacterized protein DUF4238 [Nesterenkonia sandarakina]|uniref:Uncharacterized protein DUF4238 n=2 Tax=Nesterenkonia sandarakina TaxID=272918 RepID=A0A2T0YBD0_9MICC|nr:uncharacterized protein DUF4238 [Nesterenkonia sandarakina]